MELREMINNAGREFSRRVEEFAGSEVRQKVMLGGGEVPEVFDPAQVALDYKEAVERLEKLADKEACGKVMSACGCTCQSLYDLTALQVREQRRSYATEDEFLDNFRVFHNGTRIERKGKDLIQRFNPGQMFDFAPGLRCACMLIGGLPKGVYASPTVCECSRAFTQQRWETILGRPVDVEIVSTAIISDTGECTFIIHLWKGETNGS